MPPSSNENAGAVEQHLGRYLDTGRDAFAALNTAFLNDGAYVRIAKGKVLEQPIHLLFVSTSADTPQMTHPRNLIVAEDESQIAVVEDYVSLGGGVVFLQHCHRVDRGRERRCLALHARAREHRYVQRLDAAHPAGTQREHRNALHPARRRTGAQQRASGAGGRGRRVPDQRSIHRHRAAASRQLHAGGARGSRTAAVASSTTEFSTARRTASFTAASSSTRTRRRPTPSRPIATCCSPTMRRSTPSRSSRFTPTT